MSEEKLKQYGDRAMALDSDGKVMQKVAAQLTGSNVIQPVDLQTRYSQTIMTHNAVSVEASGLSSSSFLETDGFDKIALISKSDANSNHNITIEWSYDGVNIAQSETVVTGTSWGFSTETSIKAPHCRVRLYNGDASAHTMSAWAYLKC